MCYTAVPQRGLYAHSFERVCSRNHFSVWLCDTLCGAIQADQFGLDLQLCQEAMAAGKPSKCELFGKIEIVTAFPDVKVQKVTAFSDIKVEWVTAFADKPGKWQKVTAFPDYKVQFVDAFPDYKIEVVTAFPGCK